MLHKPSDRRRLSIIWNSTETRDIQTRPVFTGNILRQPGMKNVPSAVAPEGYPLADAVMKGGVLLACHHGLESAQLDFMHETFADFAKSVAQNPRKAANA